MNLIVDQGNSICKFAVYAGREELVSTSVEALSELTLREVLSHFPIKYAIYSSVGGRNDSLLEILRGHCALVIDLGQDTAVPIDVDYERSTLGSDRLAAAVGAYVHTEGLGTCLVVDAGTAVTYEYLLDRSYLGGNISPGLWLRFKALATFTNRLPLIEDLPEGELPLRGYDTHSAMVAGCVGGLKQEVNGYIEELKANDPEARILLTGGDGALLAEHFSARDIAFVPNLVLEGLNEILEYNKDIKDNYR